MSVADRVKSWVEKARVKTENGGVGAEDLDALLSAVRRNTATRQRLLYLHAASPSIRSSVLAMALHEPVPGSITEIDPRGADFPYETVHGAILDGWHVVQFPDQRSPYDDVEIDILGYEFILQKLEAFDD